MVAVSQSLRTPCPKDAHTSFFRIRHFLQNLNNRCLRLYKEIVKLQCVPCLGCSLIGCPCNRINISFPRLPCPLGCRQQCKWIAVSQPLKCFRNRACRTVCCPSRLSVSRSLATILTPLTVLIPSACHLHNCSTAVAMFEAGQLYEFPCSTLIIESIMQLTRA